MTRRSPFVGGRTALWRTLAGISVLLFLSCFSDKVAGGSSSTETGTEVSLTGRVVDGDNKGVAGVVVTLSKVGLADTTDSQGNYQVEGELDSAVDGSGILDTLVFTQEEREVATLPVTKWVDNLPDLKIIQRDISGKLLASALKIGLVEAVISGEGIPVDRPVVIDLFHFSLSSSYTGFAYFRGTNSIVDYAVYVRVLDTLGRMTGRSPLVEFRSNAGNIPVPDFRPDNALPRAIAGNDTTLGVADTLLLRGVVVDSFGGTVSKWEWNIGGTGFVATSSGDTTIVLPSIRTADYACILRVTDNDGNVASDTMRIQVTNGNPVISKKPGATISIGDSLTFTVEASDSEGIRRYLWDMNGDGIFEDSTTSNVRGHRYPATPGFVLSIVRVEDNFDGFTLDTTVVNVILDKPVPAIQGSATVKVNVPLNLTAQVTQQFGSIVMYKWDDGKSLGWDDSSAALTQTSFTYPAKGNYIARLYVRDDDGNVDSTTKTITVGNDNPVVSGMQDTTVSINDSLTFTVVAIDPEGIRRYLWDMNGDGIFEDSTTSNIRGYKYPSSPGLVRSVVRVEDNFDGVTLDTALVNVILDKPAPVIQGDATVKVNVPLNLSALVTQQFGSVVMYKWDDGKGLGWDDSSASMTSATFTYSTKGSYTTRLYVRDDDGNVDSTTKVITVGNDNPVITAALRDTTVSVNDTVPFTITATDPEGIKWYLWDYGADGAYEDTTLTGAKSFAMPSIPGPVKVRVTIHDNFDGVTHDTATVTVVLDKPVPAILGNATVKVNVPLNLMAQVTQQFGSVVMYKWDDGKSLGWDDSSASLSQLAFTYQAKGNYTIRLYVRDDDGNVDSVTKFVTVTNDNPVATGMRDTTVSINDIINMTFIVEAADPEGIKWYLWDLDGDGVNEDTTLGNSKDFAFSSPTPTFRTVIVTVWDNFDGVAKDTAIINVVLDKPIPAIQGNSTVKVGAPITLSAQVTQQFGHIVMYKWDDGKGGGWVDSSETPAQTAFTYTARGTYAVRLYVRDDDGNTDSTTTSITVTNDDPVVSGMRDTVININDTIHMTFTVAASDPEGIKWYLWDLDGDGVNEDTTLSGFRSLALFSETPTTSNIIVSVSDFYDGIKKDTAIVKFEPPGYLWRRVPHTISCPPFSIVAAGNQIVTGGDCGWIYASSDEGNSWNDRTPSPSANMFRSMVWTGDILVALGWSTRESSQPRCESHISADGITWTASSFSCSNAINFRSVVWTGSSLVAIWGGLIMTSPDGVNWTPRSSGTTKTLLSVAWTGTKLLVVGDGVALTSVNGIEWTSYEIPVSLNSVTWSGNGFAASSSSQIFTSSDGITWTPRTSIIDLRSVAWVENMFVAVAMDAIWVSQTGLVWTRQYSGFPEDNLRSTKPISIGGKLIVLGLNALFVSP